MKNYKIEYKDLVHFTGRNGYFKSNALLIHEYEKENVINIYPRTSKNKYGNCCIEIPKENLEELINVLNKIKNEK